MNVDACAGCGTPVCLNCRPTCLHSVASCPTCEPFVCDLCNADERKWTA
jgi:hypothetical protein